jgi:hypothetical protein
LLTFAAVLGVSTDWLPLADTTATCYSFTFLSLYYGI